MVDFVDKTSEQDGTPINREHLLKIQGFGNNNVTITENADGSTTIVEVNDENHILTVTITENADGSTTIVESFVGEKTISKTTTIDANGNEIIGVIS